MLLISWFWNTSPTRQLVMRFLGVYSLYCVAAGGEEEPKTRLANENIVSQLVSMGFNHLHCRKGAIKTSNDGVEEAMNWLLSHMDDPGFPSQALSAKSCFNMIGFRRVL